MNSIALYIFNFYSKVNYRYFTMTQRRCTKICILIKKIRKSVFEFLKYYSLKYNDFSDYSDLHRNRLRSFEDYHPRARLRSLILFSIRRRLFFFLIKRLESKEAKRSEFSVTFLPFSSSIVFLYANEKTTTQVSRFQDSPEKTKE